jgi:adenylate kinase family enzyme
MRIFIMGSSKAGKTRLAAELAKQLEVPHLELDSLRHQPNWQPLPDTDFRSQVGRFCEADKWVVDGNYHVVRDLALARATDVILLDYPKRIVMCRLVRRSLARVFLRKRLWNGNRESLRYLLSSDPELNVLLWSWSNFERRRQEFDDLESATFNIRRVKHPHDIAELKKLISK